MTDSVFFWLYFQRLKWINAIVSLPQTGIGLNEVQQELQGQPKNCPSSSKYGTHRTDKGMRNNQVFFSAWGEGLGLLSFAQFPGSIWIQDFWESGITRINKINAWAKQVQRAHCSDYNCNPTTWGSWARKIVRSWETWDINIFETKIFYLKTNKQTNKHKTKQTSKY